MALESKSKYNPITKWEKEKSFYKEAIVDQKTGATWPYISTDVAAEERYKIWLQEVVNPVTGEPYRGKEEVYDVAEDGTETKRLVDKEPYQVVLTIQRERTADKREFLVSKGRFIGFNEFGDAKSLPYSFIERYQQIVWNFNRALNPQNGRLIQECLGPRPGAEIIHYTMPFTEGNVDKLWNLSAKTNVSLLVKDAVDNVAQQASDIEQFKSKSFDYIKNKDYMSEKEKREKLEEFKVYQGEEKRRK